MNDCRLLLLWRYNSGRILTFSTISFYLRRSWICSAHFMSFIFFGSFLKTTSHGDLDHPAGLPLNGFHLCILFNYASFGHSIYVSKPTQFFGFNIIYYVPAFYEFFQLRICFNSPNTVAFFSWSKYCPSYFLSNTECFCMILSLRTANLRIATIIFVMSVCPSPWNNSVHTARIFMIFDIRSLKICRQNSTLTTVTVLYCTWRHVHIYDNISLNSS